MAFGMTTLKLCKISVILVFTGLLAGCATVSFDQQKSYSTAITNAADTTLGRTVADWTELHEGLSGFYPLSKAWMP